MEIFLVVAYVFLFIFILRKAAFFKTEGLPTYFPAAIFVLKVFSGCALGLVYTYYYTDQTTTDTFKFFKDSGILFESMKHHPSDFLRMLTGIGADAPELRPYYEKMNTWLNTDVLFNDNKTVVRINTLFRFFSLGHYYVHVVFVNVISFIGFFSIYKVFSQYCKGKNLLLAIFVFLFPSVLFWGSGLLKDGIMMFALGILLLAIHKKMNGNNSRRNDLAALFSLFLLIFIKLYVFVLIFPGIIAWLLTKGKSIRFSITTFFSIYLIYFLCAFNLHYLFPDYNFAELLYWKQHNFYVIAEVNGANSVIEIPRLTMETTSLLKSLPAAFCIALFRPWITDIHGNKMILISVIENIFILITMLLFLLKAKRKPIDSFIILTIFFVVLMYSLIGITTPVLGALVRYKIAALPFIYFLLIYFSDTEKLNSMIYKKLNRN